MVRTIFSFAIILFFSNPHVFFLINEPVWTGAVQENMGGSEEGLPWIEDTLKWFCQFQAHKIPCHQGWKRNWNEHFSRINILWGHSTVFIKDALSAFKNSSNLEWEGSTCGLQTSPNSRKVSQAEILTVLET